MLELSALSQRIDDLEQELACVTNALTSSQSSGTVSGIELLNGGSLKVTYSDGSTITYPSQDRFLDDADFDLATKTITFSVEGEDDVDVALNGLATEQFVLDQYPAFRNIYMNPVKSDTLHDSIGVDKPFIVLNDFDALYDVVSITVFVDEYVNPILLNISGYSGPNLNITQQLETFAVSPSIPLVSLDILKALFGGTLNKGLAITLHLKLR